MTTTPDEKPAGRTEKLSRQATAAPYPPLTADRCPVGSILECNATRYYRVADDTSGLNGPVQYWVGGGHLWVERDINRILARNEAVLVVPTARPS